MSFVSTRWEYKHSHVAKGIEPIAIELCRQHDGSILYAIRHHGACYTHDGKWEHEPLPSSRDEEFFKRCRWSTWEEAAKVIEDNLRPNGRFQQQVDEYRQRQAEREQKKR